VRLNAMARYLGILVGPAVGGAILIAFGPSAGIMLNTLFYLPLVFWLINAPYGPRFRKGDAAAAPRGPRSRRHRADDARHQGSFGHCVHDAAGGGGVVLRRQRL